MTWHDNLWALTGSTYSIYLLNNYSWCCFWYFFSWLSTHYILPVELFSVRHLCGLESYSVSCSVSINCNLIVPLLRNPLIFERIAMGRCFPFFFYFPSSISFSLSPVSSECLIFVFVPCCLFFSVNVFNFLFASHSHLFFWVLSYLIYVKSIWNQIWHWLLFPSLIVLFWACYFKGKHLCNVLSQYFTSDKTTSGMLATKAIG